VAEPTPADRAPAEPTPAERAATEPTPAERAPTEPTPTERVAGEGGSAALVKWVGRIERTVPRAAPLVGFWASVYARFSRHRGAVLAGGLAFFAVLALVPAVLSLGALAALLVDPEDFVEDLRSLVGDDAEILGWLQPILEGVLAASATDLKSLGIAGLISLGVSLYAASRFVYVARQVLDVSFELDPEPPSVLWRVLAIVLTLAIQVAIVLGVAVLAVVPRVLGKLGLEFVYIDVIQTLQIPIIILVVYSLLTLSMRFGTRARRVVGWWNLGAATGTVIIAVGTLGLGWYLSVSITYSEVVATLGSVIALELWLFVFCTAIVVSAEVEGIRQGFERRDRQRPAGRPAVAQGTGNRPA
jgi:membrane protein